MGYVETNETKANKKKDICLKFLVDNQELLSFNAISKSINGGKPIFNFQEMVFGRRKFPVEFIEPLAEKLERFGIFNQQDQTEQVAAIVEPVEKTLLKPEPKKSKIETNDNSFVISKFKNDSVLISGQRISFFHDSKNNKLTIDGQETFEFGLIQKMKFIAETYDKALTDLNKIPVNY